MEPKSQLLVFNRKEIIIIILLLTLVALLSFTLGLKMGRNLEAHSAKPEASHSLVEKASDEVVDHHADKSESSQHHENAEPAQHSGHESTQGHATTATAESAHGAEHSASQGESVAAAPTHEAAEPVADKVLENELADNHIKTPKAIAMKVPKDKKSEKNDQSRFTLQVGSHRTVAEATEQVSMLKRKSLDAFYLEVAIPGKGTWYRVGIGTYESKEEAEKAAQRLKSKGVPPYLVQRINE